MQPSEGSAHLNIPGYEMLRELGRGGMARVYLARQESLQRNVAVKVMNEQMSASPGFKDRFFREARILADLKHPNILTIHDVGEAEGQVFFAMEFLEGETLAATIRRGMTAGEAVAVMEELLNALSYAHTRGYVHRDIKPDNVMFRDGQAVLTDFGLARSMEAETRLTGFGHVMGTPAYMAPERFRDADAPASSDLYSLGVVFFEMLTGKPPIHADSLTAYAVKHASEAIPPLAGDVARFQPLVERLLAKSPEDRYATAGDVLADLHRLGASNSQTLVRESLATGEPHPGTPHAAAKKRSRVWIGGAVLGVLALSASLWLPGLSDPNEAADRGNDARVGPSIDTAGGAAPPEPSIALLPMLNIGSAEDADAASAFSAELISVLTRVNGIRIAGRESSEYFRNRNADHRRVAQMLDVAHIMEGSYARYDDSLRVALQLFIPGQTEPIWSETFEHAARDTIGLQARIAQAVAGALQVDIADATREALAAGFTTTPEVQALLRRSRVLARTRTAADLMESLSLIRQAIALDPDYAPAYSLLAGLEILVFVNVQHRSVDELLDVARRNLIRARDLGDDSAEYHGALAIFLRRQGLERGWTPELRAQLESAYLQTMARDPTHSGANATWANYLRSEGRIEEALEIWDRFLVREPLHRVGNSQRNRLLSRLGRREEAIRGGEDLLDWYPDMPTLYDEVALLHFDAGRYDVALDWMQRRPSANGLLTPRLWHAVGDAERVREAMRAAGADSRTMTAIGAGLAGDPASCARELPEPGNRFAQQVLAYCYYFAGDRQAFLDVFENRQFGLVNMGPLYLQVLQQFEPETAAQLLRDARASNQASSVGMLLVAGETEPALDQLEADYANGWRHLFNAFPVLARDPLLETHLAEEPRYQAIVTAVERDLARMRAEARSESATAATVDRDAATGSHADTSAPR